MRRTLVSLVLAVFTGCSPGAAGPTAEPTNPSQPSSAASPTTLPATPLLTATPTGCPSESPMSVATYLGADKGCFGSGEVTLTGWEDIPDGIGGGGPFIEPSWLAGRTPAILTDSLPPSCGEMLCGPWIFVHVDPASGLRFERDGRWVVATGHRQDAAAETCRFVQPEAPNLDPDELPPLGVPIPSPDAVRATCRDSFVLTSVREVNPPAGALDFCSVSSPMTLVQYAASDPACLRGRDITIVAYTAPPPAIGFEPPFVEPGWLAYGRLPAVFSSVSTATDFCPGDPCQWEFVTVAPDSGVSLGAEGRWVLLTGHIDDPLAETCHWVATPDMEPLAEDDVTARQKCRHMFVVTRVRTTSAP